MKCGALAKTKDKAHPWSQSEWGRGIGGGEQPYPYTHLGMTNSQKSQMKELCSAE